MKATLGFPNESHNELYCEKRSCAFFDTLKMLNDCLNDFGFFVINVLIDLILLKCVRMELKKKEELRGADADNADIKKHQNNVDNMILLNGLAYSVSHVPEFIVSLLSLILRHQLLKFCIINNSCQLVRDEAKSLTLISSVCQFYILLAFNENFRREFIKIFRRNRE